MAAIRIVNQDAAQGQPLIDLHHFDIVEASGTEMDNTSIKEIVCHESLLTPGLQTFITLQSSIYLPAGKNWDKVKGSVVRLNLTRDVNAVPGLGDVGLAISLMQDTHVVYRMDNRSFKPVNTGGTEEFTLHCCDRSLLEDAKSLVSKSWKCTSPGDIVDYVLKSCAGVKNLEIDPQPNPNRDYIAENIHPFQVVAQQSNVALDGGEPSYLHYMNYRKNGVHCFKSLKSLRNQTPAWRFKYADTGAGETVRGDYNNPEAIISMEFPCDFDLLAETLNGISEGQDMNTGGFFNPMLKSFFQMGNSSKGCGIGGYNYKEAVTNKGSADAQSGGCNLDVENHLLKRQAIMNLLERDKIALRLLIPWNPACAAGEVINVSWKNKYEGGDVFGTGDYLIVSAAHTYRAGGFSTTTLDCVTQTVGG